jgi:UDP-4-amino-4,6-dideoxy-N-acetyl-beta-L-altrosamine transaminase
MSPRRAPRARSAPDDAMTARPKRYLSYGRQLIEDDDIAAVAAVMRGDWLSGGPAVSDFEQQLCRRLGVRHAIACANGTAALHMAVTAAGLGPGGSAIVPSMTFMATANVVRHTGAEVIFADVHPDTGLMQTRHLQDALDRAERASQKPSVVIPVHLNGQCVDMQALSALAGARGLKIITDCCHALGSAYGAEQALAGDCRYEQMGAFSFHPVKTVTMGEGGAVTTNDAALAEKLFRLRNHDIVTDPAQFRRTEQGLDAAGQANPWYHEMHLPAWNYRASSLHCALGSSQLSKLDRFIERRRTMVALYDQLLKPLAPAVRPLARAPDNRPGWHLYVVHIDYALAGIGRAELMRRLREEENIGTQVHYLPVHRQPYYHARYGAQALPGADRYYDRALSLPLFVSMSDDDVHRVVRALSGVIGSRRG